MKVCKGSRKRVKRDHHKNVTNNSGCKFVLRRIYHYFIFSLDSSFSLSEFSSKIFRFALYFLGSAFALLSLAPFFNKWYALPGVAVKDESRVPRTYSFEVAN